MVYTSPDGITWTHVGSLGGSALTIAYGAGLYVTYNNSNGKFYSSPDLITWTARTSIGGSVNVWKIIYAGGQFVAITRYGAGAFAFNSVDGITWNTRSSTIDAEWRGLAYNGSYYIAVSHATNGGNVMKSLDGITWTANPSQD